MNIVTRRVEKAARVLSSSDLNHTEVAFESGLTNLSYFHRQFKANFGLTPGAFRRKMMEEGVFTIVHIFTQKTFLNRLFMLKQTMSLKLMGNHLIH